MSAETVITYTCPTCGWTGPAHQTAPKRFPNGVIAYTCPACHLTTCQSPPPAPNPPTPEAVCEHCGWYGPLDPAWEVRAPLITTSCPACAEYPLWVRTEEEG